MSRVEKHFYLTKYTTFDRTYTLKDCDGVAKDLNGYTAIMQVRKDVDESDVLETLSTTNGRIELTSGEGNLRLIISASQTSTYEWNTAVYNLLMTDTSGHVSEVFYGTFSAINSPTKA